MTWSANSNGVNDDNVLLKFSSYNFSTFNLFKRVAFASELIKRKFGPSGKKYDLG